MKDRRVAWRKAKNREEIKTKAVCNENLISFNDILLGGQLWQHVD